MIGSVLTGMESTETGAEYKPPKTMLEEYVERLGKLQTALHTLEFWLRLYLFRTEGPYPTVNLDTIKIGDKVRETALTDFASLRELVGRYNAKVEAQATIGPAAIDLRNALAHARIFSPTGQPPFRLLRFAKPAGGLAEVENVVDNLDAQWFEVQTALVESETRKVYVLSALEFLESTVAPKIK
jgi:hypothetical protein